MWLFGESWRTAHAVATAATVGAVVLSADFVFARVPWPRWRLAVSLAAVLLIGGNWLLVEFAPIAQAYALCLLLMVLSFRFAVAAVGRKGTLLTGLAGCAAGASACSSLLTAPVVPVVLLWILVYNRVGRRPAARGESGRSSNSGTGGDIPHSDAVENKPPAVAESRRPSPNWTRSDFCHGLLARFAAFAAGAAVPFLPVLWLFLKAPFPVRFGIIDFHLFYRQVDWSDSLRHNLELMASWIDSSHALFLGLLAVAGFLYIARGSHWERERRAEFYLSGWMAAGLMAYLCYVRPTFSQYFCLTVPFLGIPASVGLYAVGSRLRSPDRPWAPFSVLAFLLCFGLAKNIYDDRTSHAWRDYEEVARKVDQVTPRHGLLLADEFAYFMTRRTPPSGLEYDDSHKLRLSAKDSAALHIFPRPELVRRVKAGTYDTVESCDDDDDEELDELGLPDVYAQTAVVQGCKVYWERKPPAAAGGKQ
jgi:hypothetical protein